MLELTQCEKTKPSTRATLAFRESEVITALKDYASKQGYKFPEKDGKLSIWFPDRHIPNDVTKLVADCIGDKYGIEDSNTAYIT